MLISNNNIIKEVEYLKCDFKKNSILLSIEETIAKLFNYYWPRLPVRQFINNKKKFLAPYKFRKMKIPDVNKFSGELSAKKDFEVWKSNIWNKVLLDGGLAQDQITYIINCLLGKVIKHCLFKSTIKLSIPFNDFLDLIEFLDIRFSDSDKKANNHYDY